MANEMEHNGAGADDVNLLTVAAVLVRRWKTIALVAGGVVALAVVGLVLLPERYTARTVMVPSPTRSTDLRTQALSGMTSNPLAAGLIGLERRDPNQRLVGVILKSRSLEDSLLSRLLPAEGVTPRDSARLRKVLRKRTRIETSSDGSVAVEVTDPDPVRAAQIAGAFPGVVNLLATHVTIDAARRKQQFLEAQTEEARERLILSEQKLLAFQQASDAPEVQEQARRTVQAAAELQMKLNEMEVHVSRLRRTLAPDNPELRAATAELGVRREHLRRLTSESRGENPVFVPLRSSPELKVAATRLMRDFTRDEQVYISLTAALADVQIDTHDNMPVVSVLDTAVLPDQPSGASPVLILLLAGILGSVLGIGAALVREYAGRARSNPANTEFFVALDRLREDVRPLRGRRRDSVSVDR
jgi:tyrosine-protein kinase Etk/Wzc